MLASIARQLSLAIFAIAIVVGTLAISYHLHVAVTCERLDPNHAERIFCNQ